MQKSCLYAWTQSGRIADMDIPLFASEKEALDASGEIYRHYKGGIYRLIARSAKHSETGEIGVVYEHLWPHDHGFWFRPQEMFFGNLPNGDPRFVHIKK